MSKEVLGREGWEGGGEAVGGGRWGEGGGGSGCGQEDPLGRVMGLYLTISARAITGVADLVQYV